MDPSHSQQVLDRLRHLLDEASVAYRLVEHEPTTTSEASAQARGEPLEVGAKALVVKAGEAFSILVLPAHLRLHSANVKRMLGAKQFRFASSQELLELTGLVPGSVPPFGRPIFDLPLFADRQVGQAWGRVAFNAGMLTTSIVMTADDWWRIASPQVGDFAAEEAT